MVNRRIIPEKIQVNKDGDPLDKGELYWNITANARAFAERARNDVLKVKSGETIFLGNTDLSIHNLNGSDTLTIEGFVAEKDGALNSDEKANFKHIYTQKDNWGIGNHQVSLKDKSSFNVVFSYRIEAM